MSKLVLLLGTNMGERKSNLSLAVKALEGMIAKVVSHSKIYETEAWGNTEQEAFLNLALVIDTTISPNEVLQRIHTIERELGRVRGSIQYAPRIIDIDILFYDDLKFHSEQLTIPHEHIAARRFTLTPLLDILPDFIHPVHKKTIRELWNECTDTLACKPIGTL